MTFRHHVPRKTCGFNSFALWKFPAHSIAAASRQVESAISRRKPLEPCPVAVGTAARIRRFSGDWRWTHALQRFWSKSRLGNFRRFRRRSVSRLPILRRPVWCRQRRQPPECQRQGARHCEPSVDHLAANTGCGATESGGTFVITASNRPPVETSPPSAPNNKRPKDDSTRAAAHLSPSKIRELPRIHFA